MAEGDGYGRKTPGPGERAKAVLSMHGGHTSGDPSPQPATHTRRGDHPFKRQTSPRRGGTLTLRWATGRCIRRGRAGLAFPGKGPPLLGPEAARTLGCTRQGLAREGISAWPWLSANLLWSRSFGSQFTCWYKRGPGGPMRD